MPLLIRIRLSHSPIHGLGVFAVDPIPAGTPVWRFDDRVDRVFATDDPVLSDYPWLAELLERHGCALPNRREVLLPGDDARFLNHADAPLLGRRTPQDWREFQALRDIAPGEELTCNYEDICDEVREQGAGSYLGTVPA